MPMKGMPETKLVQIKIMPGDYTFVCCLIQVHNENCLQVEGDKNPLTSMTKGCQRKASPYWHIAGLLKFQQVTV